MDTSVLVRSMFPESMPKSRSHVVQACFLLTHALPPLLKSGGDVVALVGRWFESLGVETRRKYCRSAQTRARAFADMRRVVLQAVGGDRKHAVWSLARRHLTVGHIERRGLRQTHQKAVEWCNGHTYHFDWPWFERVDAQLRASSDVGDAIVWLMLQSGLRLVEVLTEAKLEEVKERETWVRVSNLVKTRGKARVVCKPLLGCTYADFCAVLARVRDEVDKSLVGVVSGRRDGDKDGNDLHVLARKRMATAKWDRRVNARVRRCIGPFTSHICRKLYGAISYHLYCDRARVSYNAWLERVMGHSDIMTSLSYSNVSFSMLSETETTAIEGEIEGDTASIAGWVRDSLVVPYPVVLRDLLVAAGFEGHGDTASVWADRLRANFRPCVDYCEGGEVDKDQEPGVVSSPRMTIWCAIALLETGNRSRPSHFASRMKRVILEMAASSPMSSG